jgi:hypothetical protein
LEGKYFGKEELARGTTTQKEDTEVDSRDLVY